MNKMKKSAIRILSIALACCFLFSSVISPVQMKKVEAAKKLKLNKKKVKVYVGKKVKLKVKNKKKKDKVKWKVKNKKIASVSKKGVVKGKKKGKTKVTCTVKRGRKKIVLKAKVTVKKKKKPVITKKPSSAKPPVKSKSPSNTDSPSDVTPPSGTGTSSGTKPSTSGKPGTGTNPPAHTNPAPGTNTPPGTTNLPSNTNPAPGTNKPLDTNTPSNTNKPSNTNPAVTIKPTPARTKEPEVKVTSVNAAAMELVKGDGQYAPGAIEEPFAGVALYINGNYCTTAIDIPDTNKIYEIRLTGASSKEGSKAGVSVYINEEKKGSVSFTKATEEVQRVQFKWTEAAGSLNVKLLLEDDDGTNDTYIKNLEVWCLGAIPDPPVPAKVGAVASGQYRNLFCEWGKTEEEVEEKVNGAWQKLFYGTDEERIYYPVGDDMAYIYTADTDDVRSEGMSYGMMICVQMNKKEEFDRLWKWAKTYMYHKDGERKGYFAWQCGKDGSKKDQNPAPDGEEYFATSLFFASARWGDGEGIYDYRAEAQKILDEVMSRSDGGGGVVNMFNSTHKMVVFVPYGNSATHTDPSYHLPAFYEVWAELADKNNEFWSEAAEVSREYFKKATNETTGLGPDYSEFDGTPNKTGNHADFRFDAWRIAANIACDYAWWAKDSWATTHADRIQAFLGSHGVNSYGNQWEITGKQLDKDHSPGLVAMNATASLAASKSIAWDFVEDFWNISPTTGKYRYYDGCLYMMGLLHCSGKFRAWLPDGTQVGNTSTISTTTAEFDKAEGKQKAVTMEMTLNGNTLTSVSNGSTVLSKGTDYTVSGNTVTIPAAYLAKQEIGTTTLTFTFSAGRKAKLSITISDSDTGQTGGTPSAYDKIMAVNCTGSSGATIQDGKIVLTSDSAYVKYTVDFGAKEASHFKVYAKGNGGQINLYYGEPESGKKCVDLYVQGNNSWGEIKNTTWPKVPTGVVNIYVKATNANTEIEWLQFE